MYGSISARHHHNNHKRPQLSIWLVCWHFHSTYIAKFVFMSFHRNFNSSYNVNGNTITESSSCKDLGIILQTHFLGKTTMKWFPFKAYKSLGSFCRVFKNSVCLQARKSLYIILVRWKLLYCSPLWRPYLLKDIESLEKIQQRAIKFILSDYHSGYRSRLIQCGILPLMYIYEIVTGFAIWDLPHTFT